LLWVECLPNDFATIHLPQLEQAVARTNESYRPSLQQKVSVERGQKQMAADARAQLKELRRLFQPQATSPTQNRTKSQCLVGIAMSAFCLLWCVVGLLPFTLVARWRAVHPTSYVMVWVAIAIAAGAAAIADFRRAMRHRAKKD